MKVEFLFAWYDIWVGVFWDRKNKWLYILPFPMIGFIVKFKPEKCDPHEWVDVHHGSQCKKCNLFYPHGHGPFILDEEIDYEDDRYCDNCGHDKEDFSDAGCEICCPALF